MRWRLGFLGVFLFCAAAMAFALYEQFYNWVMPCLMCVYERMAITATGLLALLLVLWRPKAKMGIVLASSLLLASALTGVGVALRHLFMQYGPPDPVASCAAMLPFPINLNDPFWPRWLGALIRPVGDCSQIDFELLGLTMPAWVLLACFGIVGVTLYLARWQWRARFERRFWR